MIQVPSDTFIATRGGEAFIASTDGELVVVLSTLASPPGSTFEARGRGVTIRVKVRSCRRDPLPDGRPGFRIEGRFVSLSNAEKRALFGTP